MNAVISRATGVKLGPRCILKSFSRKPRGCLRGLFMSFVVVVVGLLCFSLLYIPFIFKLQKLMYPSATKIIAVKMEEIKWDKF